MKTKVEPLVHLNTNPCKMCMPMGAMTAFSGIKGSMCILHGSQGCATYIRRHMATHYNEPVDIASSSLTEHGTVYGGEDNLKKGLKNMIQLYHPEVIGVGTTCLAETIGEDTNRILDNFRKENPEYLNISIIPTHSPGYGGTQFEGYFNALYSIVSSVEQDATPNGKINVITSEISPGDTRVLKEIFQAFELEYILLPDLSENLDGIYKKGYHRLPEGGTDIADIQKMAGSFYTLEITNIVPANSPGKYLKTEYGVPYEQMNLPVGLRDTDALLKKLSKLTGRPIPEKLKKERGRYLDAMIDSHKYNSQGRAVVFGNPDFILSVVRLCGENGVVPVVAATGTNLNGLEALLEEEIRQITNRFFISDFEILTDTDFKKIEEATLRTGANLLIGNSDGRRIEENLGIPLVRRGFPIHDRVGGQRLTTMGYMGTLTFLDEITNAILGRVESSFREELYETYFPKEEQNKITTFAEKEDNRNVSTSEEIISPDKTNEGGLKGMKEEQQSLEELILEKTKTHPCYNCAGHKYARMHLPVAPACNIQCNYCVRKFDCPNESRPGVTTKVLSPEEALAKYKTVKEKFSNLTVVGIAGPGDALANFNETKKTLELIRKEDPDVTFCLSTNGLMLPNYAQDLVELGVTHVTVTMNAVDPKIGAKIYKHIFYMGTRYEGESAAAILLSNQLAGLRILTSQGIICKVNIVTLKGINDEHIPEVVKKAKEIGCYITNIMPMIPVEGSVFENNPVASNKEIEKIREDCGEIMKQMTHCRQCRADAIGTLDDDRSIEFKDTVQTVKTQETGKKRVAAASKSGMFIDQHFGQVSEFYIYDINNGESRFVEKRKVSAYCNGPEECGEKEDKIKNIINCLHDCDSVIAMRIGEAPKRQLMEKNIQVFVTYDRVEDALLKSIQ